MRDLIGAEWMKAWTGRTWYVLFGLGTFVVLLSNLGLASQGAQRLDTDAGAATLTDDLVRNLFAMLLFAALFGAIAACREQASGAWSRSVLVSRSRDRLLAAKLIVVTGVGLLFGVLAVALAVGSTVALLSLHGHHAQFTRETWLILLGVFVVNVLAAPWGLLIGMIVRHQVAAVAVVMALCLLVEPALQHLVPAVAKFLPTIAMSSVYRDVQPDLLPIPLALAVIAGWLVALGILARGLLSVRDIT